MITVFTASICGTCSLLSSFFPAVDYQSISRREVGPFFMSCLIFGREKDEMEIEKK